MVSTHKNSRDQNEKITTKTTTTTLTTTITADQCLSPANHTLAEGQKSDSPKVIYIYICYDLTSLSAKYMTITTTEVNIVGIFSHLDYTVRIGYN